MYAKLYKILLLSFAVLFNKLGAQSYAPVAGQPGTSAMYKDSSAFINWAVSGKVKRGYQDVSNPSLGFASAGDSTMVSGKAETNGIVSLGDGGTATCEFQYPIKNGQGYDFAVFENGFDDTFLELAFVEVSSDGLNFFRFPSHSLTDTLTQTGSFGLTTATKINNLAGKYRTGYGTPFDLQELANTPGLDLNYITHVKVIDVVGAMNNLYATRDSHNRKVNDPWPTAFPSGGFDLDAIGVIHENRVAGIHEQSLNDLVKIYPNPVSGKENIRIETSVTFETAELLDFSGKSIMLQSGNEIETARVPAGIYLLKVTSEKGIITKKILIQ